MPVIQKRLMLLGILLPVIFANRMWVTITRSTPARNAAFIEGKFSRLTWERVWGERTLEKSLLAVASPKPGKCLAVAPTPVVAWRVW